MRVQCCWPSRDTAIIRFTPYTSIPHTSRVCLIKSDTPTDMLLGEPKRAICIQRFNDSLNSAIHTTYRSWLSSSTICEPRDPLSKVVCLLFFHQSHTYVIMIRSQPFTFNIDGKYNGGAGGRNLGISTI